MLVVDASALYGLVAKIEPFAAELENYIGATGEHLCAPSHLDVELIHALRRGLRREKIELTDAVRALEKLELLRIERYHSVALSKRIWMLRDNLTAYDAAYVALAEALRCPLLTADAKLANAPGIGCEVNLIAER